VLLLQHTFNFVGWYHFRAPKLKVFLVYGDELKRLTYW